MFPWLIAASNKYGSSASDTTPDAFTFTDQTDVALSTVIESNAITVLGINAPSAITVTGGEYKINAGAYTSAPGSVELNDTVTARHTSSGSNSTAVNTVVTIGGVSDTFTTTTVASASTVSSITKGNITWDFGEALEHGTFVLGEPYVVKPTGTFNITAITNAGVANGTMVNLIPEASVDPGTQGFNNAGNYSDAKNIATSLPYAAGAGESIISTLDYAGGNPLSRPTDFAYFNDMEVLTVLAAHPAADSFRPTFYGTDKTIPANKSDLSYALLGTLALLGTEPSWASIEALMSKTWSAGAHYYPHINRESRPYAAMDDYGRDICQDVSLCAAMLNMNYSNALKETTALQMCQVGIDFYGAHENNVRFYADGGQSSGFKAPIVIAGALLGIVAMRDIGIGTQFGEDVCFNVDAQDVIDWNYLDGSHSGTGGLTANSGTYLEDSGASFGDLGSTGVIHGQVINNISDGSTAILKSRTSSTRVEHTQLTGGTNNDWEAGDQYEITDLGMAEWKHTAGPSSPGYRQWFDDGTTSDRVDYRDQAGCCTAGWWLGELLAIEEMGLKSNWGNDVTFDYMERWQSFSSNQGNTWYSAVYNAYHTWTTYPSP